MTDVMVAQLNVISSRVEGGRDVEGQRTGSLVTLLVILYN